jgi:hypothetical protein
MYAQLVEPTPDTEHQFWKKAIDQYTALHGVMGLIAGYIINSNIEKRANKITALALTTMGFEIFEQWYFKEIENPTLELGVNTATDILIGFAVGYTQIDKK